MATSVRIVRGSLGSRVFIAAETSSASLTLRGIWCKDARCNVKGSSRGKTGLIELTIICYKLLEPNPLDNVPYDGRMVGTL